MKNKDIQIEKNFLPPIFFNKLKTILTSQEWPAFPWHFSSQTVYDPYFKQDDHFMFTHILYFGLQQGASVWFKEFEPIVYFLDNKIKLKKLLRMKLNLYTNQNKIVKHGSHTDINKEDTPVPYVTVSILNFTTCNGGTIIKGKKYPSHENEVLIFDNVNKHSGIVQTDTQARIVLNIATA